MWWQGAWDEYNGEDDSCLSRCEKPGISRRLMILIFTDVHLIKGAAGNTVNLLFSDVQAYTVRPLELNDI